MNIRKVLAGMSNGLVALGVLSTGMRYLLSTRVMSYHQEALGSSWEMLSPGTQVMTLNFMKSAAAGFVTCAVAIIFLLVFPFRKGEPWSRWALLSISLCELSIIAYCTHQVKSLTPANPPLVVLLILVSLSILGFLLFPKADSVVTVERKGDTSHNHGVS